MTPTSTCPQCGLPLPVRAPEGLCPGCLLKAGLETRSLQPSQPPTIEPAHTRTIDPAAGLRVRYFGDYELLEEIARGGMGVVYKARQVSLNRPVALKMILAGQLATEPEIRRFRTEAEAAANLQHPNIVAIHEVGEHEGRQYFSMDLVEGSALSDLGRDRSISPRRAAGYVKTVAAAVHFAHQRGTLHRDLKPANILIDESDQPRITDFGLAKQLGRDHNLTEEGTIMGSPSYMAPEQAAGRLADVGPVSDVYALGAVLYELLTGQPPFLAPTPLATLRKVLEDAPVAPRVLNPDVPVDLETICLKCLEKRPVDRYGSAQAVVDDLGRFLDQEPIHARPATRLRKAESWVRRHPWLITGAAVTLVLGLLALVDYLLQQNAFLRAQQLSPGLVRAPGVRTEKLEAWGLAAIILCDALMLSWFVFFRKERKLEHWRDAFDPSRRVRRYPVGRRLRAVCLGGGATGIAFGLAYLDKAIETFVWEGSDLTTGLGIVYTLLWIGSWNLISAIKNERHFAYGRTGALPTRESLEPMARAIAIGNFAEAARVYRQAVPDASAGEAHAVFLAQLDELRAGRPDLLAGWLAPWRLDPVRLGVTLLVEAAAVAAILLLLPAQIRASRLIDFLAGWMIMVLLGLGASLNITAKQRTAITLIAIGGGLAVMTILPAALALYDPAAFSRFTGHVRSASFLAFFAGIGCGFTFVHSALRAGRG